VEVAVTEQLNLQFENCIKNVIFVDKISHHQAVCISTRMLDYINEIHISVALQSAKTLVLWWPSPLTYSRRCTPSSGPCQICHLTAHKPYLWGNHWVELW